MRYIAPMIVSSKEAMKAVQGMLQKVGPPTDNTHPTAIAAYEADE
jgi:hypothetical protein